MAVICFLSLEGICQRDSFLNRVPENLKNRNVFKRFMWFYEQRAYPCDTFPAAVYRREVSREIAKLKQPTTRSGDECKWRCIGPYRITITSPGWGFCSGRTRALAIHTTDPNTVYIGAACGGIWKTTDGGASWMDIGRDLESLSFGALAIDPSKPTILYAGTTAGVFKYEASADNGGGGSSGGSGGGGGGGCFISTILQESHMEK